MKKVCALVLAGTMILQPMAGVGKVETVNAGVADEFVIPAAEANGRVGALVPYTRYDSKAASLGGGASLATSPNFDLDNIATQASEQSYVKLPSNGSYAEWTMNTVGDGATMRFTMPDSGSTGLTGSVDVYVNGNKVKTVNLTSYYMWQYFSSGHPSDTDDGGAPAFAFDEVHFMLDKPLKVGDTIRIQSSGANGLEYGVDFLEIETVEDMIEQPSNSVNVMDYGAYPDDGIDDLGAIRAAVSDADSRGMDVYFPAGTFHLSGMWNLYCSNMKITGAGMWYTNLQFTSSERASGGIAGGNGSNGGADGYCKNLEFCNMYINSSLNSRYNQEAVYKCFMDVFADGSVIHDVWEEHFECGFWFGDYNGAMDYSDGVKVIDCRIRNNLADGVNFCQGTSNATVYNCSIRNNGDDGLAMWNNNHMNAKDETGNVFAYNTIDFIWRAGGIAVYGGNNHKVYNNYICDTFMSAGIHLNTTFPGYAFNNTTSILVENNVMVRSGCAKDCWQEEFGAIDLKGSVNNVTFNNNQIYDAQHDGIRIMDGPTNITFNNTKIFGAGVDGQEANYSSISHKGAAIRLNAGTIPFNGLEIANIAYQGEGTPYFFTGSVDTSLMTNVTIYDNDTTYDVPAYPDPENNQGGGIVNPLEGITGYDVQVVGLSWENESSSSIITEGEKVAFSAAIKNNSSVDIPEGVSIGVKITVDGKGSYTNTTYKGGLKAGGIVVLTPAATWTATAGGHTLLAIADYQNKLPDELDENNNTRAKTFNAQALEKNTSYTAVTGGYDLVVTDITWGKETIAVGEEMTFTATVVNAGDTAVPSGTTIGVQFQIDEDTSVITWCDSYNGGLAPGASVDLTANGGTNGNTWTATSGIHTLMAWVDDTNRLASEVDENNNQKTITIEAPYDGVVYVENPDQPDDLDNISSGEIVTKPVETTIVTETTTEAAGTEETTAVTGTTSPIEVIGQEISSDNDNTITVVWGQNDAQISSGQLYNVYVDGEKKLSNVGCAEYVISGIAAGTHTVKITAVLNGIETAGVAGIVIVSSGSQVEETTTTVAVETTTVATVSGYDLIVTDIKYDKASINVGDQVVFSAVIKNQGDTDIAAGTIIGYQIQVDGDTSNVLWCDTYSDGLKAGESVELTVNSGTNSVNYWVATNGSHTLMAWVDDIDRITGEANENNNKYIENINVTVAEETTTEEVTAEEETTTVAEASKVVVEINGYQISTSAKGHRTVYSVSDPENKVASVGMVYGLTAYVDESDMVLNSANENVFDYQGTEAGKSAINFSELEASTSYTMTMKFDGVSTNFYTQEICVRAYAILNDGTVVYSDITDYTVYEVADNLYQNLRIPTYTGHIYLYNDILKAVNPDYKEVDYDWGNIIVKVS